MITLRLQTEALTELEVKARKMGKESDVALVGAQAAADLTSDHLFRLDETNANHMGGERTHFYASAAKSVQPAKVEGRGAAFIITQIGLALRWLGGTITAGKGASSATGGPTKYLAIPARSEAYGKTPGEFDDLQFVPRGPGRGMLVQALQTAITFGKKLKSGARDFHTSTVGGLVMYWLVTSVTQQPDPNVMPSEKALGEAARLHMDNYLSRLLQT